MGSVPIGLAIAKARSGTDIRTYGSGGTGGTNVARLLGWPAGLAVVALDAAKGFLAVRLVALIGLAAPDDPTLPLVAGLFAVVGQVWPVFVGFHGGKGVATTAGVLLAIQPVAVVAGVVVFAVVLAVWRFVSLASLAAVAAVPLILLAMGRGASVVYALCSAVLIGWAHRGNLTRLRAGAEPKVSGRPRPPR